MKWPRRTSGGRALLPVVDRWRCFESRLGELRGRNHRSYCRAIDRPKTPTASPVARPCSIHVDGHDHATRSVDVGQYSAWWLGDWVFLVITYSGPVAETDIRPAQPAGGVVYRPGDLHRSARDLAHRCSREIAKAPVWGHGPGVLPSDFMPLRLSAHNYYLQLALQVGFTGVALLMAALASLYHVALKVRRDGAGLAGALAPAVWLFSRFTKALRSRSWTTPW